MHIFFTNYFFITICCFVFALFSTIQYSYIFFQTEKYLDKIKRKQHITKKIFSDFESLDFIKNNYVIDKKENYYSYSNLQKPYLFYFLKKKHNYIGYSNKLPDYISIRKDIFDNPNSIEENSPLLNQVYYLWKNPSISYNQITNSEKKFLNIHFFPEQNQFFISLIILFCSYFSSIIALDLFTFWLFSKIGCMFISVLFFLKSQKIVKKCIKNNSKFFESHLEFSDNKSFYFSLSHFETHYFINNTKLKIELTNSKFLNNKKYKITNLRDSEWKYKDSSPSTQEKFKQFINENDINIFCPCQEDLQLINIYFNN